MSINKWYLKYLLMFLFLLFSLIILEHVFIYFTPFIIAAVIASLINPIVDYLDSKVPIHRGFTVIIVLVLVILILVTMIIIGGAQGYLELNRLLTEEDKKILDNILENEIENPYVLVNRQPTLKFQSTKSLKIESLEDEDVMRIPSALLEGYNGDHK